MGEDDVRPGEVLAVALGVDHVGAEVSDELRVERADRRARGAPAGRRALHVQQTVGEVEIAALDQLDQALTIGERRLVGVAEDGIAFELHEAHRRREPRADEPGQLVDDRVGVLELGAGEERRVARDVGQQQVAPSGQLIPGHGRTIRLASRRPTPKRTECGLRGPVLVVRGWPAALRLGTSGRTWRRGIGSCPCEIWGCCVGDPRVGFRRTPSLCSIAPTPSEAAAATAATRSRRTRSSRWSGRCASTAASPTASSRRARLRSGSAATASAGAGAGSRSVSGASTG